MKLVDTHCHLNLDQFANDLPQVIEQAEKDGVEKIVVPAINIAGSLSAIALADKYPAVFAAVGIHPNDGNEWDDSSQSTLIELCQHPKVVAIGEIGLDNYWQDCPATTQYKILREQLDIAHQAGLPVILHSREALHDLYKILKEWNSNNVRGNKTRWSGVLHAFEGNLAESKQAFELGFLIGLGGPVTYKNAQEKQTLAAYLPMDRFVLETDAPFLSPHPFRGKRNNPQYVKIIAEKIAQIRNIQIELLAQATTQNANDLFAWET